MDAETLFDNIGRRYEDVFANNPNLRAFIHRSAARLPHGSCVLDVGCGTGKPVAEALATAGHRVHGIDVSQEMVRIAQSQVPGTFEKVDMRLYQPAGHLDGVFAILSLFFVTPGDTHSMLFRFSEWLRHGGIVVIGVGPSDSLPSGSYVHDPTWDCARQLWQPFLGYHGHGTYFSKDSWHRLLRGAGFIIEDEECFLFNPNNDEYHNKDTYFLVCGRKVEENAATLGPFPEPSAFIPPLVPLSGCRVMDLNRLVSPDLHRVLNTFPSHGSGLVIGLNNLGQHDSRIQHWNGPLDDLPFKSGQFDWILAAWSLNQPQQVSTTVTELVRVANQSSHAAILLTQGAPDNEAIQFLNSTSTVPMFAHQGSLLRAARDELTKQGFEVSLQRIHAHFEFPEEDVSERCNHASEILAQFGQADGLDRAGMQEELASRLHLHFQTSAHSVGHEMVILRAIPQRIAPD
ncbi:S-adenosyl-L-methionine-dependent methyltransferase [Aspergillus minisclerotigenes]|uniref:S-adenosyl-L-methionine-dependent methyltransferase n=1 Tax=Aspergillus minisclerotigenes TaxID=656917 RepID=A0A5N6JA14_9EURO|nr:S-adenosyl-L-methionine-dependent methyltransferase [Aspergillus minisclerotigenes]